MESVRFSRGQRLNMRLSAAHPVERFGRRAVMLHLAAGALAASLYPCTAQSGAEQSSTPQPGPLTPILGNAMGTRVMAVYFDYHCPYCRRMDPLLPRLVERNPDLRILFKEFPILRWDSQTAARIALSAQLRGRYFEVHARLMRASGDFTGAVATDIARWLDVDPSDFRRDMGNSRVSAELERNAEDAQVIGIRGTPAVVTAAAISQGGRTLEELQSAIDALR
jgi:protein-disulfide isomerase